MSKRPSRLTREGEREIPALESGPEKAALTVTKSFAADAPPPKSDHDRGRGGDRRQKESMKKRNRMEISAQDAEVLFDMAGNMDDDLESYFSFKGDEDVEKMRKRWEVLKKKLIKIINKNKKDGQPG